MKEHTGNDGRTDPRQEQERFAAGRRSFLKWAGASAGGVLLPTAAAAQTAAPAVTGGALYRETDHIRRYYELAR
jgi:hypothetical protein